MTKKTAVNPTTDENGVANALQVVVDSLIANAHTKTEAANFFGTAERVARMYTELSWSPTRMADELNAILNTTFPVDESEEAGMVVQGPIVVNSCCPHHLVFVRYHAYVGYLPKEDNNVLGLSKLARIPDVLSHRFVLQEQLAKDIADALYSPARLAVMKMFGYKPAFETEGSIALLVGVHCCEACRGVRQDARTMVTERRGAFRDETMESRFMQAVSIVRAERPFGG